MGQGFIRGGRHDLLPQHATTPRLGSLRPVTRPIEERRQASSAPSADAWCHRFPVTSRKGAASIMSEGWRAHSGGNRRGATAIRGPLPMPSPGEPRRAQALGAGPCNSLGRVAPPRQRSVRCVPRSTVVNLDRDEGGAGANGDLARCMGPAELNSERLRAPLPSDRPIRTALPR